MSIFAKVRAGAEKRVEEKKERMAKILNQILDLMQFNKVSLSEMSDIIVNLQVNYQRELLDEINKLKANAGNTTRQT